MTPELFANEIAPQMINQWLIILLGLLMLRDGIWKAIALWKTGNQKKLARFICIFIFNTAGILPIIYLIFFNKKKK